MIVLFITFYNNSARSNMLYHDRFMEFKANEYYIKSDEIHLGRGVT